MRNWGPLWANNCFYFEDGNRLILKMKKSPTHVGLQIARNFLLMRSLFNFSSIYAIDPEVVEFFNSLFENRVKFFCKIDDFTLIGNGKPYKLSPREAKLFKSASKIKSINSYQKIIYKKIRYTSEDYERCTKTCDYYFQTESGDFGLINKILVFEYSQEKEVIIIFKKLKIKGSFLQTKSLSIDHIKECEDPLSTETELEYCVASKLYRPCIFMRMDNECYIAYIPKGCLMD